MSETEKPAREPSLKELCEVILDFQRMKHFVGTRRESRLKPVARKAAICIGVRRCGKTTYLHQLLEDVVASGVARENILYLNFFDDRLYGLGLHNVGQILSAYFSLYPEKKGSEKIYCFFDEIQSVPGWERFVDRLLRTEECEVYLSGSSAELLSKEIATQMRGRSLSWEMFPFSFREFLFTKGITVKEKRSTKDRLLIEAAFREYWEHGGFPEVIGLTKMQRVQTHQEYFHAILYRDLIERHAISQPKELAEVAHRLLNNVGSLYSQNKLSHSLRSAGLGYQKAMVANFVHWFEDAYFLFSLQKYDASIARSSTSERKVYCIDHALVPSIASRALVNAGHLLENLVFVGLRRVHQNVFYYRTEKGHEVDFIVPRRLDKPLLVQVCETLVEPKTRKRELRALNDAMAEQGVSEGMIVTRDEREMIEVESGMVEVIPAWEFLLSQPIEAVI